MGKQKKHGQKERREEKGQVKGKETLHLSSFKGLKEATENGKVQLSTPAAVKKIPITKAGKPEYDHFFELYAIVTRSSNRCPSLKEAMAGKQGGMYFLPLGFIPGPAILLSFRPQNGGIQGVKATPDVAKGMKIPTLWQKVAELPAKILQALKEWQSVIERLGYEPSPYNLGFAHGLLEGRVPSKFLAMMMPHFRYRPGDPELPLGVVLIPTEGGGGMKVEKIHNPRGIPDIPKVGTVMTLSDLKNGKGPVQKLLRTWALMEGNFLGRYDREGKRLQVNLTRTPDPHQTYRRPIL